jgi:hypothetical protein
VPKDVKTHQPSRGPPIARKGPAHSRDGGHAALSALPASGWVYEEKVDGWQALPYKDAAGIRLISRNGRDLTRRFAELAAARDAADDDRF